MEGKDLLKNAMEACIYGECDLEEVVSVKELYEPYVVRALIVISGDNAEKLMHKINKIYGRYGKAFMERDDVHVMDFLTEGEASAQCMCQELDLHGIRALYGRVGEAKVKCPEGGAGAAGDE